MSADEKTEIECRISVLQIVDRICEEFEVHRDSGTEADIADYLDRVPPELRDDLFAELFRAEAIALCERQCMPRGADYVSRYPAHAAVIHSILAELESLYPEVMGHSGDEADTAFGQRFIRHFKLGAGGQGEVWLAQDRQLERFVAVKVVKPTERSSGESLARFWREAYVTSKLEHPNIVPIYEAGHVASGDQPATPYYAMRVYGNRHLLEAFTAFFSRERAPEDHDLLEALTAFHNERSPDNELRLAAAMSRLHLDASYKGDRDLHIAVDALRDDRGSSSGRNLREAIDAWHAKGRPPHEFRKLLTRFIDVCDALAYAHSRGVIHRDLKPENVMLGEFGETLVVDWGLAKIVGTGSDSARGPNIATVRMPRMEAEHDTATRVGEFHGSVQYASPEQACGKLDELGPATDIYSLGAILYVILTGRPIRVGDTWRDIHDAACEGRVIAPRAVLDGVPQALEAICLKALSKSPSQRYASVKEFAADVGRWLADEPVSVFAEPWIIRARRWARHHPALTAGTFAGVVAVGLLSGVFNVQQQQLVSDLRTANLIAERQTALSSWDLAHRYCEDGDVAQGLLVMAQVLESLPADAEFDDLENALRLELGSWQRHVHSLTQVWEHPAEVLCLAVSPDGEMAATGCADGNARLWAVASGELRLVLKSDAQAVSALAFMPDGQLVTAGLDGEIIQWNLETGEQVERFIGHEGGVRAVAISPDGDWLLSGGADDMARLWRITEPVDPIQLPHAGPVNTVGFSPTDSRFFTGGENKETERGEVFLHDLATAGQEAQPLRNASDRQFAFSVRSAAFSQDGKYLLVGDSDWNATLWEVATGEQLATTDHAQGEVIAASFSADGRWALVAGDYSHQALIWNLEQVQTRLDGSRKWGVHFSVMHAYSPIHSLLPHPAPVTATVFVDDHGDRFLTACKDGQVRLWQRAALDQMTLLAHHPRLPDHTYSSDREYVVRTVAMHPSGEYAATGCWDGSIQIWRVSDGARMGDPLLTEVSSPIMSIAFSPDGASLIAGAKDGFLRVWDWQIGECTAELRHHCDIVSGLSVSSQGDLVLAGGSGAATLWNLNSAAETGIRLIHSESDESIATGISPRQDRFLTVGESGTAKLWDEHGGLVADLPHELGVWNGSFSRDGSLVITASDDESVRIWDAQTGQLLSALQHECSSFVAEFLTGPNLAVTGSREGGQIWDTSLQRRLGAPCRHAAEVVDLEVSPDGKYAVLADWNGFGVIWKLPAPIEGTPDKITARIEATLGLHLDDAGSVVPLEAAEWKTRRETSAD